MIDSIKITSLTNIGANLSYTSIFPVVNTVANVTNKVNLQIIGNYILNQAGGANMVQAAQATLAQAVVNSAQPNITSVGTLTSLAVTGNITGGNLLGPHANGNSNVNIPAANGNVNISAAGNANILVVTGTGANITGTANITGNANVGNIGATTAVFTTGNITTINSGLLQNGNSNITLTANGNISLSAVGSPDEVIITATGINVAGTLNANGNANVGNLGAAQVLATANITSPQLISNVATGTAPLVVTSTTQVANLNAATSGTVRTNAQPNITSVGTLTSLAVTGNTTSGNFVGSLANGNSSVRVVQNGSIDFYVQDAVSFVVAGAGISSTGVVLAGSNVTAPQLISNVTTGTAPLVVTSTTRVANLSVNYANVADFITVAAGTGNNFFVFANAATGNVAEVTSTGLTANLSANSITATTFIGALANGNSNVNIATANGNVTIAAVGNTTMTVTGTGANITGTLNVTGNITGNTAGFAIGYLNIPQVAAANATLALTDAGKHYYSTSAGNFTLTIPSNASVGFSTGSAISVVVQSAGNVLVNAAAGVTLYMAGNSTAANRIVSNYGMATLLKVATDTWMINGTGVA